MEELTRCPLGKYITVHLNGLFPTIVHFEDDDFFKKECCRLLKCQLKDLLFLTENGKWIKGVWSTGRYQNYFTDTVITSVMAFKNSNKQLGYGDNTTVVVMEELAWIVAFNEQQDLIGTLAAQLKCEDKKVKMTTCNGKEIKTWKGEKKPGAFIETPFLYAFSKA